MRRVALGMAGILALAGCGVAGGPSVVGRDADRSILQAETRKPTLKDLEGQIPPSLDPNEAAQVLDSAEDDVDVGAAPPEASQAEGTSQAQAGGTPQVVGAGQEGQVASDRQVMQRGFRGGFRGIGPGFMGRSPGFMGRSPGFMGRFPGRHHVFFPRHRAFFRHRIFFHGRFFRPFFRSNFLFYPVVYGGSPYFVQYCWSPTTLAWVPCEVIPGLYY